MIQNKNDNKQEMPREPREDVICGRNSVMEALKSGRELDCLMVIEGEHGGSLEKIVAMAKSAGIPVKRAHAKKLEFLCGHAGHQGVALITAAAEYATLDDLFARAEKLGEKPFFVICDGLQDPHNLGAVIRTAEAAGAHGVIVPARRSVGLTASVSKVASGALEYLPVARVANLASCIETLKKRGVWIYGADMDGEDYLKTDFSGAVALVIGAEGEGLGRLIKEKCDACVSLPIKGKTESLNASVAAGILIYRVLNCR